MAAESRYRDSPSDILESLRALLLCVLSKKQLLILSLIANNRYETITTKLSKVSIELGIPLSTLKLNYNQLCIMGLAERHSGAAELTELGKIALKLMPLELCNHDR